MVALYDSLFRRGPVAVGPAAAEPAQQAAGILHTLGSLRPVHWWPGLDEVIETARGFCPGRLAEAAGR